jgi:hypothetical protein
MPCGQSARAEIGPRGPWSHDFHEGPSALRAYMIWVIAWPMGAAGTSGPVAPVLKGPYGPIWPMGLWGPGAHVSMGFLFHEVWAESGPTWPMWGSQLDRPRAPPIHLRKMGIRADPASQKQGVFNGSSNYG